VLRGPPRGGARGGRRLGPQPAAMDLGLAGRVALVCGSTQGLGAPWRRRWHRRAPAWPSRPPRGLGGACGAAALLRDRPGGAALRGRRGRPRADRRPGGAGPPRDGRLDVLFWQRERSAGGALHPAASRSLPARPGAEPPVHDHLARAAVPIMRKVQWGRIICLASVAAKQPLPGLILSTTARAGVLGFAKALADEVAPEGITVNVVCPGYIATERIAEAHRDPRQARAACVPGHHARDAGRHPLGRMGHPDELGGGGRVPRLRPGQLYYRRRAAGRRRLRPRCMFDASAHASQSRAFSATAES